MARKKKMFKVKMSQNRMTKRVNKKTKMITDEIDRRLGRTKRSRKMKRGFGWS